MGIIAKTEAMQGADTLPMVWPGVDRDVPSGDGWKGCWTLVLMILHNEEWQM